MDGLDMNRQYFKTSVKNIKHLEMQFKMIDLDEEAFQINKEAIEGKR